MATYYVDPVNGNNANNGLGPDASDATNKPFATIAKLLEASGVLATGDTAYLAPGVYNETITITITSYTTETFIIGDPLNTRGFKTSGGVLVAPGNVLWTNHTSGLTSAGENNHCLALAACDHLTIQNISFYASHSNVNACISSSANSTDIKLLDCSFVSLSGGSSFAAAVIPAFTSVAVNWLIERCYFYSPSYCIRFNVTQPASADVDLGITIKNCIFSGATGVHLSETSGSFIGGGIVVDSCTFYSTVACVRADTNAAITSTTYPVLVKRCLMFGANGVVSNHSSHLLESYNLIACNLARNGPTAGTGSQTSYAAPVFFDRFLLNGLQMLPMFSPHPLSPALALDASGAGLSTDFLNRPRPSGTSSANKTVGALERHDYGTQDSTVYDAGSSSIRLLGPGDHEILIPVDAASTTISIKVQYDNAGANDYTGTDYPQAILLDTENFANISGGTETETATASAAGAWETLTFTAFTPSRKGVVRLRLVSRDTAGDGYCYFDTLTVT